MRKLLALSIIILAMAGGGVATNTAQAEVQNVTTLCPGVVKGIEFYRTATWKWQDKLGISRSKSTFKPKRVKSCEYAKWVARHWQSKAKEHRKKYEAFLKSYDYANSSIWRAINFAGPVFGVSVDRLSARISREGGHGGWICNRQGSGACGWFQFMSGTYYAYSGRAFSEAAERGVFIPRRFDSWYSPLGQSVTAAYMFSIGLECSSVGWAASC